MVTGFEKHILTEMMSDFPEYTLAVSEILMRLVDMSVPFSNMEYYAPMMKGSFSIKSVLPALIPEMSNSYKDLPIQDGGTANVLFLQMMNGLYTGDIEECRSNLLRYCKLDTWAMVRVFSKIASVAQHSSSSSSSTPQLHPAYSNEGDTNEGDVEEICTATSLVSLFDRASKSASPEIEADQEHRPGKKKEKPLKLKVLKIKTPNNKDTLDEVKIPNNKETLEEVKKRMKAEQEKRTKEKIGALQNKARK
jgi:hypothetical protein